MWTLSPRILEDYPKIPQADRLHINQHASTIFLVEEHFGILKSRLQVS